MPQLPCHGGTLAHRENAPQPLESVSDRRRDVRRSCVSSEKGSGESGARASPPATTCLVLSGFIRRFTQISQIFCSARRMGGTSVCSSGRRFTPPPLNAERPTPDSERRSEKTPKSLPINCEDYRIFRIGQHHVNHGYMRPRSGKSCPINCQDARIFRIGQHHVNHGYMRPRSGKSCPINCQNDRIFRIEQHHVNHVLNVFQGFFAAEPRGGLTPNFLPIN